MADYTKEEFLQFWGVKGYLENWEGYDKDWSEKIKELILKELGELKHKVSLEIGCGAGYWTNFIHEHSLKTFAIDLIPKPSTIHNEITYIENNNQQYNCNYIESNSIDFIFSYGVFCHLSLKANDKYLQDIIRVMKPNSKALLMYADETAYRKFCNDPTIKTELVYGQFNDYSKTMEMMKKYPITAERVLDYRDSLILIHKSPNSQLVQ